MPRRSERETPPTPLPVGILFQHAFALGVAVQERVCPAMLALRAATDVIIRKMPAEQGPGPYQPRRESSPTQTVAERTYAPAGRSVSWRRKPPAGNDRIPAASACVRRVAERRARQCQRSPHRGAGCWQNSIAQCLWLAFERTQRGVYQLTADGEAALRRWPDASVIPCLEFAGAS